jgi:hypothetical protein
MFFAQDDLVSDAAQDTTAYDDFAGDGMREAELQRFAIYARYDPARMLTISEPPADSPQTQAFYHYARAEAFAHVLQL